LELPACDACNEHVPADKNVTVWLVTVHTAGESEEKLTGRLLGEAMALGWYVSPTIALGLGEVKSTVCGPGKTEKLWLCSTEAK